MVASSYLSALSATIAGIIGLLLFTRYRWRLRPVLPEGLFLSPDSALAHARSTVADVLSIDVSMWENHQSAWFNNALLQHGHQTGLFENGVPEDLLRDGVLAHWRTTFRNGRNHITVGISRSGAAVYLTASGPAVEARAFTTSVTDGETLTDGESAALTALTRSWSGWQLSERRQDDGSDGQDPHEVLIFATATARRTVRLRGLAVIEIRTEATYDPSTSRRLASQQSRSLRLQFFGWPTAVIALIIGIAVLVQGGSGPPLLLPFALALSVMFAIMILEGRMYAEAAGLGQLGDLAPKQARVRHFRQIFIASVSAALFVGVSASVGLGVQALRVAGDESEPLFAGIAVAVGAGIAWLGMTTAFHGAARTHRWWFSSPELTSGDVRRTGMSWTQVVSIATQSAVAEEVLFRLVLFGVVTHVTAEPLVGLLVSALAWALSHDARDVRPPYVRVIELFLLGVLLAVLFLWYGLLPVIALHFVYNMIVVGRPLLTSERPARSVSQEERAGDRATTA